MTRKGKRGRSRRERPKSEQREKREEKSPAATKTSVDNARTARRSRKVPQLEKKQKLPPGNAKRRSGGAKRALSLTAAFFYRHAHLAFPLAASVLTLWSTHILLGPELNRSGDNMYHLMNEYALMHGIRAGDNPLGPLGLEFGQPVLRFYQALFYVFNVVIHFITNIDLKSVHNVAVVLCFAASPFTYLYFLKKVGLSRWAAAIGSFASMTSIAAFGNSFEAYHQSGIVTQSMGGFFFPWFLGHFIGVLKGENRASTTAFLFALACLSHAVMSVFAVIAGSIYFLVIPYDFKKVAKRLAVFCVLGVCLVSFWLVPFIQHTGQMRPIPDSIIRTDRPFWFNSLSKDELAMVLFTGRLLDDPPNMGMKRTAEDKLMDQISIIGTLKTRKPVVSALTGVGALFALLGIRRSSRRYLLSGFLFSCLLFAGADDYRWLNIIPFMKNIQTFRCTYLIELFAFGLVAIAIETVFRRLYLFGHRWILPLRIPWILLWLAAIGAAATVGGREIRELGKVHLFTRDPAYLNAMLDACSVLPHEGQPFRITPIFAGRFKLRQAWFGMHGYVPYCTHWKGTGPTAAYHLCFNLAPYVQYSDLNALAGVRYFSISADRTRHYFSFSDQEGDLVFDWLPNGEDRNGANNRWHHLFDTGRDHFLRPLVGRPLPVVCSHAQWVWLVKAWTERYRSSLWERNLPLPMRVEPGALDGSGLLDHSLAILYLNHIGIERDRKALDRFVAQGGRVISPKKIEGIYTRLSDPWRDVWSMLPSAMTPPEQPQGRFAVHRERYDPGFEHLQVTQLNKGSASFQRFAFDIDALESEITILPMQAVPGWTATLDGEPLPTFPAGPDMVGAYIPKGAHRLVFRWQMPFTGWLTLGITSAALLVILLIWLHGAWLRLRVVHALYFE